MCALELLLILSYNIVLCTCADVTNMQGNTGPTGDTGVTRPSGMLTVQSLDPINTKKTFEVLSLLKPWHI